MNPISGLGPGSTVNARQYIWDTGTLSWQMATGGSGAGSVTVTNFPTNFSLETGGNLATLAGTVAASKVKTTPDNPSNLDVALSTRLKPADTLTKVTTVDTITNVVHVDDNAGSLTVDGVVSTKTVLTPASPTFYTTGITSGQALASNANRKGLIIVNTSINFVSLGISASAVLYSGITLNPKGGAFWMDEYSLSTGAINAIASGAASNIGIQEFS